jgi:2-methylcitrate dehydratase PrpD
VRSLAEIVAAERLHVADIDMIDVHTHRGAIGLADVTPASLDHAQYSFPFVLATQLVCGAVGAWDLTAESITDPDRLAVAARVHVHHDPALDAHYPARYATRIVVTTTEGRAFERTRLRAPGDPDDPMSVDDLSSKFVTLATPTLGDAAPAWSQRLLDTPLDARAL